MNRSILPGVLSGLLLYLLAACAPGSQASVSVITGDILQQTDFSSPVSWQSFALAEVQFTQVDGEYLAASGGGGYIWSLNDQSHTDVVIEVTTEQLSSRSDNAYGVMCRAHPSNNGMGYYFLINGNGRFSIRESDGIRNKVLLPWTDHSAIRTGKAHNTLRAVCVGDYLAMYVNGQFVGETRDPEFTVGHAGFAINGPADGGVAVMYDDLTIIEASMTEATMR